MRWRVHLPGKMYSCCSCCSTSEHGAELSDLESNYSIVPDQGGSTALRLIYDAMRGQPAYRADAVFEYDATASSDLYRTDVSNHLSKATISMSKVVVCTT